MDFETLCKQRQNVPAHFGEKTIHKNPLFIGDYRVIQQKQAVLISNMKPIQRAVIPDEIDSHRNDLRDLINDIESIMPDKKEKLSKYIDRTDVWAQTTREVARRQYSEYYSARRMLNSTDKGGTTTGLSGGQILHHPSFCGNTVTESDVFDQSQKIYGEVKTVSGLKERLAENLKEAIRQLYSANRGYSKVEQVRFNIDLYLTDSFTKQYVPQNLVEKIGNTITRVVRNQQTKMESKPVKTDVVDHIASVSVPSTTTGPEIESAMKSAMSGVFWPITVRVFQCPNKFITEKTFGSYNPD